MVSQNRREQTEDIKILIEIYKSFRDELTKLKKNTSDAYRIYIPALFGLMIAFSKLSTTDSQYLIPVIVLIEFFLLVTYGQVVYDLTDIICISVELRFIEKLIKDKFGEEIVIWEKEFSEPFKMINPQKNIEKVLKHFYVWIAPILIALVWSYLVISILEFQTTSLVVSASFFIAIMILTWSIGKRRLDYAEKFAKNKQLLKKK